MARRLMLAGATCITGLVIGFAPPAGADLPPGLCKRMPPGHQQQGCEKDTPKGQCKRLPPGQEKKCQGGGRRS